MSPTKSRGLTPEREAECRQAIARVAMERSERALVHFSVAFDLLEELDTVRSGSAAIRRDLMATQAEWRGDREARERERDVLRVEARTARVAGIRQAAAVLAEWAATGSPAEDDEEPITVDEGKAIARAAARIADLADAIERHG